MKPAPPVTKNRIRPPWFIVGSASARGGQTAALPPQGSPFPDPAPSSRGRADRPPRWHRRCRGTARPVLPPSREPLGCSGDLTPAAGPRHPARDGRPDGYRRHSRPRPGARADRVVLVSQDPASGAPRRLGGPGRPGPALPPLVAAVVPVRAAPASP